MELENYRELLTKVAVQVGYNSFPKEESSLDKFLPFIEKMRLEGAVILVKWDGERKGKDNATPYTVLVSGNHLNGDFFRVDADFLEDAFAYIIVNYARRCWAFEL